MGICIVSFSSRKNGNCTKISNYLLSQFSDTKFFDFSDFAIGACGNCLYQCFEEAEKCPLANDKEREILDAITNSSFTYFIVPDYCDYPCANFFIFNERSLCYFQKKEERLSAYLRVPKKFIVISNTGAENFKTAFAYHCETKPDILFLSAKKYGKISTEGDLINSEQVMKDINKFIKKQ